MTSRSTTRRIRRTTVVHMLKERSGRSYTTMCGQQKEYRANDVVPITVWHSDVTCFDCLNRGVSYDD